MIRRREFLISAGAGVGALALGPARGQRALAAAAEAQTVMKIETQLAQVSLHRVSRRDASKQYHKMGPADLKTVMANFDWVFQVNNLEQNGWNAQDLGRTTRVGRHTELVGADS